MYIIKKYNIHFMLSYVSFIKASVKSFRLRIVKIYNILLVTYHTLNSKTTKFSESDGSTTMSSI